MVNVEHVHEKVLASTLLFETAGKSSAIVDRFSGWLLAGYAAAVTFLVTNSASLSNALSPDLLRATIRWLFVAVLLAVAEKFLATILAAASSGASMGRKYVADLNEREIEIDIKVVLREMERAMIPPMRWIVARSFRKAESGDLTAAARNISRCGQVQALLVLAQAGVILYAIASVARRAAF